MDSSNTVIVSAMVEEKGGQTADKKEGRKPWTLREFGGKTLWDWLQLLIVPVVLSLITVVFAWQQDIRQQQIENQRAEAERELAVQRAQDEALQAYLDQMSTLMLEKDLRNSEQDSEVRTLARARTLTVIRRVDPSRKGEIMNFLVEADLVREVGGSAPVIELDDAVLPGANLNFADLNGAELAGANLQDAQLFGADLRDANLRDANLHGANLSGADLHGANLLIADLGGANLNLADLPEALLIGAHLPEANLRGANLHGANLGAVTSLHGANLDGANLQGANLKDAKEWTEDQLSEADSLEGATMPNGQKFEDWLKDQQDGKENG